MTKRELIGRIRNVLRVVADWYIDKKPGRDLLVILGALLVARGVAQLLPGTGTLVLGLVCLYVALWHGPLIAYLLRAPQPKE